MIIKLQNGAPVYAPDLKTLKATRRLIGRGTRKVAEYGLTGLGWLGEALNNVITAGASSDFGQTSPFTFSTGQERRNILKGQEQAKLQVKLKIDQGMTWVSPLNYGAALWNGHGLNAEKGAKEISTWDPRWQLLGRVGEIFTVAKGKPTVKAAIRTGDRVLAKAGNKGAKGRVVAREMNKTFNGTSFIKDPQMEDVITLNTGSLSRKPVYLDGNGLLDYQDYVTRLGDKFKSNGARVEPLDLNAKLIEEFNRREFTPIFLMWPGKSLRAHGLDIIRRMEQQGMDVDKTQGHLPLVGDGSIRYLITKNSELPSFIGYYRRPGSAGTYFSETGTTIIDPTMKNSTVYSMQHERNMHGTLRLLTPEMWKPYEDFLYKLFPNLGEKTTPMGRHLVAYNSDNLAFPISPRSLSKKELRATLGEYRKYLYDNVAYPRAKADGLNVKPGDLDVLRPYFENAVDELTFPDAKIGLRDTNGYGLDYAGAAANHPNFLEELKWLLKYAPASLPLLIPRKEEKK